MSRKKKEPTDQGLIIDKQLRAIIPSLNPEKRRDLETKIMNHSLDPVIVTWNNTILAGYEELEICQARGMNFQTKEIMCFNQEEAIEWICAYALKKYSDSTEAYNKYQIGLRYITARINKKLVLPPVLQKDVYDEILNMIRQHRTATTIAKELQISIGTVQKYGLYAKAVNSIMSKNPVMASSILQERIHVSHTNILLLEQLNADELRRVNYRFDLGGAKIVGIAPEASNIQISKPTKQPGIKAMPAYDPDAEFAGLMLTAKSWTSSLERTYRAADFQNASKTVKVQLYTTLVDLKDTLELFCLSLEDT